MEKITKNFKTKLSLQIGDDIASWENGYMDNSLEDLMQAFIGLLVTHTFIQSSIDNFFINKGEELKETLEPLDIEEC